MTAAAERTRYWQVDAFTDRLFAGNPAGVCLLEAWPPDERLREVAAENNLSETAFVVPGEEGFALRWFTPEAEVDLCGHATLAAAHVLYEEGISDRDEPLSFETASGPLRVRHGEGRLWLDFPARPGKRREPPPALVDGLGRRPQEVLLARDYLAVYGDEEEVRDLTPDLDALESLDCLGTIVTAPGSDADFVSRFFAPAVGVPEDPVTGSSHCTLVPYWTERLGERRLHGRQLSRRGGEVWGERRGDRVLIGGRAVRYLEGTIRV